MKRIRCSKSQFHDKEMKETNETGNEAAINKSENIDVANNILY